MWKRVAKIKGVYLRLKG